MWCRSTHLIALVVKLSDWGAGTLNSILNEFKSKTQIYSKYKKTNFDNLFIKHDWKYPKLHK